MPASSKHLEKRGSNRETLCFYSAQWSIQAIVNRYLFHTDAMCRNTPVHSPNALPLSIFVFPCPTVTNPNCAVYILHIPAHFISLSLSYYLSRSLTLSLFSHEETTLSILFHPTISRVLSTHSPHLHRQTAANNFHNWNHTSIKASVWKQICRLRRTLWKEKHEEKTVKDSDTQESAVLTSKSLRFSTQYPHRRWNASPPRTPSYVFYIPYSKRHILISLSLSIYLSIYIYIYLPRKEEGEQSIGVLLTSSPPCDTPLILSATPSLLSWMLESQTGLSPSIPTSPSHTVNITHHPHTHFSLSLPPSLHLSPSRSSFVKSLHVKPQEIFIYHLCFICLFLALSLCNISLQCNRSIKLGRCYNTRP